ncbi:MAG: IPT/TIG domain-containing protein [Candidatus Kapabacteria bacterium]|nr:IPT/TIG domain-containing protein [Candidatus Kapabacteria bacterium]
MKTISPPQQNLFIENKGQWDAEARFLARLRGMNVWITDKGLVYDVFQGQRDEGKGQMEKDHRASAPLSPIPSPSAPLQGHVVKMNFLGSKQASRAEGMEKQTPYFNYFLGNDKSKWASNVPSFSETRIHGLYEGISARVYFDSGQVRYDMIVEPGADASQIALEFEGADDVFTNRHGELVLKTSVGELLHGKLYAYQVKNGRRVQISCRFTANNRQNITFALGEYDPALPLVIDPLVWSTYFGGAGAETPLAVQIDAQQRPIIAGTILTTSNGFPFTVGAYNITQTPSSTHLFISKFTADVSSLVFSTFFGGTTPFSENQIGALGGAVSGGGLAIDATGNILVAGSTNDNTNFPIQSAFQSVYGGGTFDAFVAKFSEGGSLLYSTYIGSSSDSESALVAADNQGNAYLAVRHNNSSDVPNAYSPTVIVGGTGTGRVTVVRLSSLGVVNYTLRAQSNSFNPQDICVDRNGFVYIVGQAFAGYPVTPTRYSSYVDGDVFLMKINPVGAGVSDMVYSTYIGTMGGEYHIAVDVDDNGRCYIAGRTQSTLFPTTPNAFQSTFGGGTEDGFLAVIDPNIAGTAGLIYGTYFGVNEDDIIFDVKVGKDGTVSLLGYAAITTPGAMFTANRGGSDVFYSQMDLRRSGKAQLLYSTAIGGAADEGGRNLALDNAGQPVITGFTSSTNFPVSPRAFQRTRRGGTDGFLLKLQPTPEFPLRTGFGSSIEFDGTQRIQTQTSFARPLQWTVECWVRSPEAPSGTKTTYPFTHGSNPGIALVWDHTNPAFRGSVQVLLADGITFIPAKFGNLQGNTWYHLAATFDGRTLRAYQDGILTSQQSIPSALQPNTTPVIMGFGASPLLRFRGTIDEARYWNTALPATTIARFAGQEIDPTHPNWSNLIGYWNFNTYEGLVATDISPNKNGASLIGMYGDASVPAEQGYSLMASPRSPSNLAPRILPSIGQLSSSFPVNLLLQGVNGGSPLANVTVNGQTLLYTPRTGAVQQGFTDRVSYRLAQERDTVNSSLTVRFFPEVESRTTYGLPNQAVSLANAHTLYGGTAPFQYAWSPTAGLSSTNASAPSVVTNANISYTLTITDAAGFQTTTTVNVNVTGPYYYISGDMVERASWSASPDGNAPAPQSMSAPVEFIVPRSKVASLRVPFTLAQGATLTIGTGATCSITGDAVLTNLGTMQVGGVLALDNRSAIRGQAVRYLSADAMLLYTGTAPTFATTVEFPQSMTIASVSIENSGGVNLGGLTRNVSTHFQLRNGGICNTSGATLRLQGAITFNSRFADDAQGTLVIEGSGAISGGFTIAAPENTSNGTFGRLRNLTINRTGAVFGIASPLALTETLTLTNGTIRTTDNNPLRLLNTGVGAIVGGSRTSFVEGTLERFIPRSLAKGNGREFLFPLGQGEYMPLSIVSPETPTDSAFVRVSALNLPVRGRPGGSISVLAEFGYWQASIQAGSVAATQVRIIPRTQISPLTSIVRATSPEVIFESLPTQERTTTAILSAPIEGALLTGTFTWGGNAPPRITGFSPAFGPSGTVVRVRGQFFGTAPRVQFGNVSAASVRVLSATELDVVVGAGATGKITVTTEFGTISTETDFRYFLPPSVEDFLPKTAPEGARISIIGREFSAPATVFFGGVQAEDVVVNSETSITAVVGRGTSGEVQVRTPSGTASSREEFGFEAPPVLTRFDESAVSTGNTLTIIGENFLRASEVRIGGVLTSIIEIRAKRLVVRVPAGITMQLAPVQVVTPFGSNTFPMSVFISLPAQVRDFTPKSGSLGTLVTVRGSGLRGVQTMTIAGTSATILSTSDSTITATIGTVRFRGKVVVRGSTGEATSQDDFSPPPVQISTLAPIAATQGTVVVLRGQNFSSVTGVTIGGVATRNFTIDSPTQISVIVPNLQRSRGIASVQSDGRAIVFPELFTIVPTEANVRAPRIESFSPERGGTGTVVTVRGVNLDSALVAYAGNVLVERVTVRSSSEIAIIIGAGESGGISVLTPNGTARSQERFTYLTPLQTDSLALRGAAWYWAERSQNRSTLALNWLSGLPLTEWRGITLQAGRVTGISVTGASLQGEIPDTLKALTALRTLILSGCGLVGALPNALTTFSALETLNVSNNALSGTIASILLQSPTLRSINLSRNKLEGSLTLGVEAKTAAKRERAQALLQQEESVLEELDVSQNSLTGRIPPELAAFGLLKVLNCSDNRFEGAVPDELASLSRLEDLRVSGNRLTNLPSMANVRRLQRLSAERNRLDFGAIEPNLSVRNFSYIPQDSLEQPGRQMTAPLESRTVLRERVGGGRNSYQWLKNGIPIDRAVNDSLVLPFVQASDVGAYSLRIESARVRDLPLTTHTITLQTTLPLAPNDAPSLLSPLTGSVNVATDATLRWTSLQNTLSGNRRELWYEVEVSSDSTFRQNVRRTTTASAQAFVSGLDQLTSFAWRVRAVNRGGNGVWSETGRFITAPGNAELIFTFLPFTRTVIQERSRRTVRISNQTRNTLTLQSLIFIGADRSEFTIANLPSPLVILPDSSIDREVQFAPQSGGRKIAQLEARFTLGSVPAQQATTATFQADVGILSTEVRLQDTLALNRRIIGFIKVVNRGQTTVQLDNLRGLTDGLNTPSAEITFSEDQARSTLGKLDTAVVAFTMTAKKVGNVSAGLSLKALAQGAMGLQELDNAQIPVERFARELTKEDVVMRFGVRASATLLAPGSETSLEIVIDSGSAQQLITSVQPDWTAQVQFDRNVLALIDGQGSGVRLMQNNDTSEAGRSVVSVAISNRLANNRDRVLARIRCRVVAGATTATVLRLNAMEFTPSNDAKQLFLEPFNNGRFEALPSRAGGTRLIVPNRPKSLISTVSVQPNPARDIVEVQYSLSAASVITLVINDITGKEVYREQVQSGKEGTQSVKVQCSAFPSGTYSIILRSEQETRTVQVVIVR